MNISPTVAVLSVAASFGLPAVVQVLLMIFHPRFRRGLPNSLGAATPTPPAATEGTGARPASESLGSPCADEPPQDASRTEPNTQKRRDQLVDLLLTHQWASEPADLAARTAHARHTYHYQCAICCQDLGAIADLILTTDHRTACKEDHR